MGKLDTSRSTSSPAPTARGRLAVLTAHLAPPAVDPPSHFAAVERFCVLSNSDLPTHLKGTLSIVDERTGKAYKTSVSEHGTINASDLKKISAGKNDKGIKLYDPGYLNTAPVRSAISYIDGDEGILRYRGYPIEELAEKSTFVEVAYLIS
ncbi:unnamed protein product [Linum tenue]|uniref:Citrate synthase n=1 Tax=Linum tenue TaxID=586396 RepID=A0AAV0MR00_9ROSI|nr:unnamed protein product [Linum tenue]